MPKTLTDLLAEKLRREPVLIENELTGYLTELVARLKAGVPCEVRGFGAFTMSNGDVRFQPDEDLERAVNFRYAGLEPLSFPDPAETTPATFEPVDLTEEEVIAEAELVHAAGPASDHEVAPAEENEPVTLDAELSDGTATSGSDQTIPERASSGPPSWEPVVPPKTRMEAAASDAEALPYFEPISAHVSGQDPGDAGSPPPDGPDDIPVAVPVIDADVHPEANVEEAPAVRRRRWPYIAVPVILALVVVAALVYSGAFSGSSGRTVDPERPAPELENESAVPSEAAENQDLENAGAAEAEIAPGNAEGDVSGVDALDPNAAVADSSVRSFVSAFDRSAQGYTLIVQSVYSDSTAQVEAARYESLDLPRAILVYEDGGVTRYRVAVGQFESIERAQAEMALLGNRIPSDTWIRRIR